MTGLKAGGGTGLPSALAASIQPALALRTSAKACSDVSPKAEQWERSGISAMYPPSSSLKKYSRDSLSFLTALKADYTARRDRATASLGTASPYLAPLGDSGVRVLRREQRYDGCRLSVRDKIRRAGQSAAHASSKRRLAGDESAFRSNLREFTPAPHLSFHFFALLGSSC